MTEVQITVPDQKQTQEDMFKPALEVGDYLAVVTKVETKTNPIKGSYGINWSLLINGNPASIAEGWDAEAKVVSQDYYTYIGKLVNGKLEQTNNSFNTAAILAAFDLTGTFAPSQVLHRQIVVKVEHRPSLADQDALKADPTHVVERYYPNVKSVRAYTLDGNKGPVLQNLADAATDQAVGDAKDTGGEF